MTSYFSNGVIIVDDRVNIIKLGLFVCIHVSAIKLLSILKYKTNTNIKTFEIYFCPPGGEKPK